MPTSYGRHLAGTQAGYVQGSTGAYTVGGGDINFANDQMIFIRFSVDIPKGASVSSATLTLNIVAKQDQAQQCSNAIGFQLSGNPPRLVPGVAEWPARWGGGVSWPLSWTALRRVYASDGSYLAYADVDVTSAVNALVTRSDWVPGASIVCMIYTSDETGSDMGIRANNDFLPRPELNVVWTVPAEEARRTQINLCPNSEFDPALDPVEDWPYSVLPYWYQNPHFGAFVEQANYGTFDRTTDVSRVAGRRVAKFTSGAADGINKRAGIYTSMVLPAATNYVMCGWAYVPSATVEEVGFGSVYLGGQDVIVERDQWVPFCSTPVQHNDAPGFANVPWTLYIKGPRPAPRVVYFTEPAIVQSDFRLMPFNGQSSDTSRIDYAAASGPERSNRVWTPRTRVDVGGVKRGRSRWTKHPRGLMVLSEV